MPELRVTEPRRQRVGGPHRTRNEQRARVPSSPRPSPPSGSRRRHRTRPDCSGGRSRREIRTCHHALVRRRGRTKDLASKAVREALKHMVSRRPGASLTADSLLSVAATMWLDEYRADAEWLPECLEPQQPLLDSVPHAGRVRVGHLPHVPQDRGDPVGRCRPERPADRRQ